MLIKKYGARFNKGLKIINLRDILLLSFYLGIVALSSFLMLDSDFRTQWKTTRTLFSVYRGIARMDYYFRGSLRSYLEQFTLANTVIYTENWFMFVPPRVMGERLDVSKMVANNAHTVLETEDIIGHALTEVSHFKMALAQSVNEFKSDVYLKDMPDSLKDQILKTRLKIVNYNGTNAQNALSDSQVSGVTFLGIFKVVMEKFERNLIVLRPFLKGKRPKYNFNFRVVYSEFGIVASEARFGALRNGWADSMDFHNKSLRSVNDLATETEPKNSQKKLMQLVSISASLLFLYVVLVALFIRNLSNWLLDFLTQYRNLRPEEIDLQKLVFRGRLTFFQRHRLDEQTMIKSYFKQVYSVQNIEMANLLPRKEPAKASVKPRRSGGKKNGIAFPSIVVYSVLSSLTLALVLYYVVAISKVNNSMKRAYRLMDLYTTVYERLTDSYHVYMYHSLYLTIGNYLLVDGQLLSTKLKTKGQEVPTQKLIQFLTTSHSEIDALYGSPKIDQMLFRNVCDSIPQNISRYDFFYSLCKRDRHASKGFIQFLYHQIDMMEEYRSQFDSLPIFEKSTMTTWVLFPFQTYMYKKPTYSFIVACNLVYDTVYNNLMTTGDLAIRKELLEIERLINSLISIIPPISIVIYLLLKVWLVLTTLRQDLVLCGESLFNMLPEVISQNKVICRKFSEAYSMQY